MAATTLGLADFPSPMRRRPASTRHVMGVVVMAWLTRHPVERWGAGWAGRGSMRLRYLEHLDAGTPLDVRVEEAVELGLEVLDDTGRCCANGAAGFAPGAPATLSAAAASLDSAAPGPPEPVPPLPHAVDGLVLRPLVLPFDAVQDLAFVEELADGPWWRDRGWAHPAWVASAVNEVIGQSIAFADGGYWRHAGSELRHVRPIPSGSELRLYGQVERVFQGAHHRFALARVVVAAAGQPAAEHVATFVYGASLAPDGARRDRAAG
jgi:hypothetical protein